MTDLRRVTSFAILVVVLALLGACAAQAPTPSLSIAPVPTNPDDGAGRDPATRTACLSLDVEDCRRAHDLAASVLTADDPVPTYIQVGPFGCAAGDRCPTTLDARPEGDVVIEFPGGQGINVHLKVGPDGAAEVTRDAAMGVAVEPTSSGPIVAGPMPFTLGHCGIYSGIDIDGDWWDPIGPVDAESGDAVNATAGVVTFPDPTHALFVAPSGFSLRLERRDGAKLLPFCM